MARWTLLFVALAACGTPSHPVPVYEASDEPPPPPPPPPAEEETTEEARPALLPDAVVEPFLYAIHDPAGQAADSVLFVTFASGITFDQAYPADHLDLIDQARVVYLMAPPGAADPSELAPHVAMPEGHTAAELFPARIWNALTQIVPVEMIRHARPMMAMVALQNVARTELRAGPAVRMQATLAQYVQSLGNEPRAFFTHVEEVTLLGSVPDREYVAMVSYWVDDLERLRASTRAYAEAYYSGDEMAVAQVVEDPEQMRLMPSMARMTERQSGQILRRLEPEVGAGNAFFAIHASAAFGMHGVLEKLRTEGYALERVR